MDTSWYKRAVDHHAIEPDSFVFSVPFDSGYNGKNSSVLVTAAHAMFIEHRGHKAPAAVVGLQYTHESLAKHFINITSAVSAQTFALKFRINLFNFVRSALAAPIAERLARRTSLTATFSTIMDLCCSPSARSTLESFSGKLMEQSWTRWCRIEFSGALHSWISKEFALTATTPIMQLANE